MNKFVYVMWRNDGAHKVGVSKYPEGRIYSLRTAERQAVSLIFWLQPSENAFLVEARVHKILSDHRLGGEWFDVDVTTAVSAVIDACVLGIRRSCPIPGYRKALERAQKAKLEQAAANEGTDSDAK